MPRPDVFKECPVAVPVLGWLRWKGHPVIHMKEETMHSDTHFDNPDIRDDPMEYLGEGADPEQKEAAEHYELEVTDENEPISEADRQVDECYYGDESNDVEEPSH
jgi:hypothetical protein